MSFHNLRALFQPGSATDASRAFDRWLGETVALEAAPRWRRLARWTEAPWARVCHPREEHLLPLLIAAGAAGEDRGTLAWQDELMGARVSAYHFG